jgi:hypothetical protein
MPAKSEAVEEVKTGSATREFDALIDEPTGYGRGSTMDTAVRGFRQMYGRKETEEYGDLRWINGYARALMDAKRDCVPARPL